MSRRSKLQEFLRQAETPNNAAATDDRRARCSSPATLFRCTLKGRFLIVKAYSAMQNIALDPGVVLSVQKGFARSAAQNHSLTPSTSTNRVSRAAFSRSHDTPRMMTDPNPRPLPDGRSAGTAYWRAAGRKELVLPQCEACRSIFWPPRTNCPSCGSRGLGWIRASGLGSIHTLTVIRQNADPYFARLLPYVVAMVDLDEGVRIMTNIVGSNALDAEIGTRVKATFDLHGEIGIPVFEIDPDPALSR
jgi:uncharacterized OB-fold protein